MPREFSQIRYTPPEGQGPIQGTLLAAAEAAWRQLVADLEAAGQTADRSGVDSEFAVEEQPYEAQVLRLPCRLLADYRSRRSASDLGQILDTAAELAASVDRVAIVGDVFGGTADLFCQACLHPYFNELSRAERGGQPRLYFLNGRDDNDHLAGWLDLVAADAHLPGPQGTWGIVAVNSPERSTEVEWTLAILIDALRRSCERDEHALARRFVGIGSAEGLSAAPRFSAARWLPLPAAAQSECGLFSASGLLPAALAGLDVRRPLDAAERLVDQFCDTPPADNPIVQFAAQQFTAGSPTAQRIISGQGTLANWQRSFGISLRREGRPPAPALKVPAGSKPVFWWTDIVADYPQRDRLAIPDEFSAPTSPDTAGEPRWLADELARRRVESLRKMDGVMPCDVLHIDRFDPAAVGELCEWLLISAVFQMRLASLL